MAEHKQGSMDIREQEKTFAGFIKLSIWGAAISIGAPRTVVRIRLM